MKNLLSRLRKWWSSGAKLRGLHLWDKIIDLKDWLMSHLTCHMFWKSMILIISAVMLHFGCVCPWTMLKVGLLSWGLILLHEHHSDHWHV